jgi:hypothetical protein
MAGGAWAKKLGIGSCCAAGVAWKDPAAYAPVDAMLLFCVIEAALDFARKPGIGSSCGAGVF